MRVKACQSSRPDLSLLSLRTVADFGCPPLARLPASAFPQQVVDLAVQLNAPLTETEIQQGLDRLHNGRAKGVQGLPAELLRYAKLQQEDNADPSVNVLVPALTKVLNAAFLGGVVPPAANVGHLISPEVAGTDVTPLIRSLYSVQAGSQLCLSSTDTLAYTSEH